jgi:putative ABC transport system substrate-binding protein
MLGAIPIAEAFRQGLRDLGYIDGKTITIMDRSAEGKAERLPALAAELVQLTVDVIVATTGQVAEAAKAVTTTIPIVMVSGADPVAIGLVASLARPGGNITGLSLMSAELAGKQLQLLKEATGSLGRLAVLWNARCWHDQHLQQDSDCGTGAGCDRATPGGTGGQGYRRGLRGDDAGTP